MMRTEKRRSSIPSLPSHTRLADRTDREATGRQASCTAPTTARPVPSPSIRLRSATSRQLRQALPWKTQSNADDTFANTDDTSADRHRPPRPGNATRQEANNAQKHSALSRASAPSHPHGHRGHGRRTEQRNPVTTSRRALARSRAHGVRSRLEYHRYPNACPDRLSWTEGWKRATSRP